MFIIGNVLRDCHRKTVCLFLYQSLKIHYENQIAVEEHSYHFIRSQKLSIVLLLDIMDKLKLTGQKLG
jgi:hypothetical protein